MMTSIYKKILAGCSAAALSVTGAWAQSVVPGQHAGKLKVENRVEGKAQAFDLRDVTCLVK